MTEADLERRILVNGEDALGDLADLATTIHSYFAKTQKALEPLVPSALEQQMSEELDALASSVLHLFSAEIRARVEWANRAQAQLHTLVGTLREANEELESAQVEVGNLLQPRMPPAPKSRKKKTSKKVPGRRARKLLDLAEDEEA